MAALDIITLDTATPQLEVPQTGDTYNAPRAIAIAPEGLTGSAATPSLNVTQTWNTTGTPTALKLNVTDTASNAASLLMDLQVGGVPQFFVNKQGQMSAQRIFAGGVGIATGIFNDNVVIASGALHFTGTSSYATADTILARDAADTLAQRRGTNAQTFRVYNTFTDASNYERLNIVATGTSFELVVQSAGTGTSRSLELKAGASSGVFFGGGGSVQWQVNASGHFLAQTDNTYDIGASGATRPRDVYVARAARIAQATAIPAGGTQSVGVMVSSTADFGVFFGSGAPTLTAAKGSLYLRSDGSTTNDRMYVNTNGATTWTAVTTAA